MQFGSILLIDDDPTVKFALHNFLSGLGYSVIAVDNPSLGLQKLKQHDFDLVITDLIMPGMSGVDFMKLVRVYDSDMPVVIITGYPSIETAVKVMKEGANDFVTKPFTFGHVSLIVRRAIEEGRLRRQDWIISEKKKELDIIESINSSLQEKIKELSALYTISETLYHSLSTRELFEKAIEIAISITEVKNAALWVLDREARKIILKVSRGMNDLVKKSFSLSEAGLLAKVFTEKRYQLYQDYKDCICGVCNPPFRHSFLAVPLIIGREVFGALHLCQKIGNFCFSANDISLITNLTQKTSLMIENITLQEDIINNITHSITSLVKAIDAKDNYTMNHCKRVTAYALTLARGLNCSDEILQALRFDGPIHDVGKIGVRDGILLKPGILKSEEMEIMKSHVTIGHEIVRPLNFGLLKHAVVRHHHERWDGMGYPDALQGEEIPLVARICSVVDAYDAMTTDRPYRSALSPEEALAELRRGGGHQFDLEMVEAFIQYCIGEGKDLSEYSERRDFFCKNERKG